MAKILVSYYRSDEVSVNDTLCFFDSFFKELSDCGNDILAINNAYYGIFNPNRTNNIAVKNYLLDEAIKFQPDLIITFNHRILQDILDKFEDIPVVIYDGDELRFFSDLDLIKKNIGRYKVFSIVDSWQKDYLEFGFRKEQVFYLPPGTSIKKDDDMFQTMNISFLGQRRFFLNTKLKEYIQEGKDLDKFYQIYLDFLKTHEYSYEKLYQRNMAYSSDIQMSDVDLWPLFDQGYLIFANLLDLGLHLGGHESGWRDIVDFIPQLALAHSKTKIFSLKENQDFYNASILSLCPMHPQAQGKGYSWRCYDIMASNACLVSSYSSELKAKTKGIVNLPMFHTPIEAREICKDLLENTEKRRELVLASQDFIEKNGRWIEQIKKMEQILEMKLVYSDRKGTIKKLTLRPIEKNESLVQRAAIVESKVLFNKEDILWWGDKIQSFTVNPKLLLALLITVILNVTLLVCIQMGFFNTLLSEAILEIAVFLMGISTLVSALLLEGCILYKFIYKVFRKIILLRQ
ncbi:MAG: hypothetical protein HFG42_18330 [Lachnospiraceae bacterium]|nr:hypothetical protein [Lachnospiraceae bacterium]